MPKPNPGESQKSYIPRCISTLMHEKPERDHKQAIAICYSMYRNKKNEDREMLINKIDLYLGEKTEYVHTCDKCGKNIPYAIKTKKERLPSGGVMSVCPACRKKMRS